MTDRFTPGSERRLLLSVELGHFEIRDRAVPSLQRRWGCQPAEYYVDALSGLRARYDTLTEHGDVAVCIAGEDAELVEFGPEVASLFRGAGPGGRWLHAPSGELLIGAGDASVDVPPGDYRLCWFVRQDVCPFEPPTPLPDELDELAEHVVVLVELTDGETRGCEDLVTEAAIYAEWYDIQQMADPAALESWLDAPDPTGYRRLSALYRLRRLEATRALEQIASEAGRGVLAVVARQLLVQADPVGGPENVDDLPRPGTR